MEPLDLATIAMGVGAAASIAAVLIRFRSFKATIGSLQAIRHENVKSIGLEVDGKRYFVSLDENDVDLSGLREAEAAIKSSRVKEAA